jgi:hemerythrin-like domain-containing protein
LDTITAGLLEDHKNILHALQVLSEISSVDLAANELEAEKLYSFIEKLKFFVEEVHQGKEEAILFPGMISKGVADHGGPIGVMVAEHIEGRGFLQSMIDALEDGSEKVSFLQISRKYTNLMAEHIRKENEIVFPMVEKVFNQVEIEKMQISFSDFEEKMNGIAKGLDVKNLLVY